MMSSSCLRGGGGGACVFDLDVVKTSSSSWSRSSQSPAVSCPSSTLSESSNSPPPAISIKRARTPRKRPNQIYNEAAALLSATYPAVFSAVKAPRLLLSHTTNPFLPFLEPPDLLPPLPVLDDAAFLIPNANPPSAAAAVHFHLKRKALSTASEEDSAASPASDVSRESNSPECPIEDDFDAKSILESEVVAQGIDSIVGNLAVDASTADSTNYPISSLLRGLVVGRRISNNFELGFELRWALRKRDEDKQWISKSVPISDIIPNYKPPPSAPAAPEKKNKKSNKKSALGLRLNHEEVVRDWADRGSVFSDRSDSRDL